MMGYTDKAVTAHLLSELHHMFVGDCRLAIVDLTESDQLRHTKTCAELGIPPTAVAVILACYQKSGTGFLCAYPIDGGFGVEITTCITSNRLYDSTVALLDHELYYSLTVPNDVFDLYVLGYWTAGQVRE